MRDENQEQKPIIKNVELNVPPYDFSNHIEPEYRHPTDEEIKSLEQAQAIEHCRKKLNRIAPDPAEGLIIETGTVKNDKAEWSIAFTYLSGVWEVTKIEKL